MVALYDVRRILGWRIGRTMSSRPNPAKYAVEEFRRVKAGYAKLRNEDPHWASIQLAKAPAFFAKLRHDDTLQARALELVILTGAREGMALSATIDQFDLGAALWRVPIMHMKAREAFTIPLCGRALAIVEHVAGGRNDPTSLLFRTLRPYAGIKEARPFDGKVLRDRMHSEYDIYGRACTVHGWRTALTEYCYDAGFTPDTADDILAHKLPKVQGAYRRVQPIAQRTKVLSSWQDYLMRNN
jgi:integrase